jgi:hypothetical protein
MDNARNRYAGVSRERWVSPLADHEVNGLSCPMCGWLSVS